jgi:hypothetical protein
VHIQLLLLNPPYAAQTTTLTFSLQFSLFLAVSTMWWSNMLQISPLGHLISYFVMSIAKSTSGCQLF